MSDPSVPLLALEAKWREREQAMCRRADAQPSTLYAERLGEQAEQIGRCADELSSVLTLLDAAPAPLKARNREVALLLNRLVLAAHAKARNDEVPCEDRITDEDLEKIEGQILSLLDAPDTTKDELLAKSLLAKDMEARLRQQLAAAQEQERRYENTQCVTCAKDLDAAPAQGWQPSCNWHTDDIGGESTWETGCKRDFYFDGADGPVDCGFTVCPYCGKALTESRTSDELGPPGSPTTEEK